MADDQHNDPLEEFFRKKVRDYDITYNEEDWLKLERRLDAAEANATRQSYWKGYTAAAAVVLLFSILAYYTYQQQQRIDELNQRLTNSEQVTNPQQEDFVLLPEELFDFSAPRAPSDISSEDEPIAEQKKQSEEATRSRQNASQSHELLNNEPSQQFAQSGLFRESLALADLSEPPLLTSQDIRSEIEQPRFRGNNLTPPSKQKQSPVDRKTADDPNVFNARDQRPGPQNSRIAVGIMAGPDISTVGGLSNFYNPGYKIGVSVEYSLSENLALSAGAIHSKVQYTASGNDYNPPEGYWSYGSIPQKTVGRCFIIDIPINLKYNFMHFNHSRLYVGGGVSTYIMLNEDYRFTYDGYSTGQPQRWNENTGTVHLMSNASLSVGYEVDISRNMSLQFEPFLRVPIKEVGWGNVNLYSMGSFISISHNL